MQAFDLFACPSSWSLAFGEFLVESLVAALILVARLTLALLVVLELFATLVLIALLLSLR